MQDYQIVRNQLINMLEELDDKLDLTVEDNVSLEPAADLEAGKIPNNDPTASKLELADTAQIQIEKIKQAFSNTEQATYAKCLICKRPLAQAWLLDLPYMPYCIDCTQRIERK
jgi:RNA polymerase-binding transcription factor DksA